MNSQPIHNSPPQNKHPQSEFRKPQSNPNPQSEIRNPQSHPQSQSKKASGSHAQRGRPRTLDEVKRREICALISAGFSTVGAAQYVGCAASTIRREMFRNPQFEEEVRRAYLAAELSPLHAMRRAAATHWRAAAWLLERTNPNRFARQEANVLTPGHLTSYLRIVVDIIAEEVKNPADRRRITKRLYAFQKYTERESWAAFRALKPVRRKVNWTPSEPPQYESKNGKPYDAADDRQRT